MKLESALARLRTKRRIVILHYAPIAATVAGEPLEIQPFMGSGRLEDPINRYGADAVFHGHAHRGAPEGKTSEGDPGLQRFGDAVAAGISRFSAVPDAGNASVVRTLRVRTCLPTTNPDSRRRR